MMKKKIILLGLFISLVMASLFSGAVFADEKVEETTITETKEEKEVVETVVKEETTDGQNEEIINEKVVEEAESEEIIEKEEETTIKENVDIDKIVEKDKEVTEDKEETEGKEEIKEEIEQSDEEIEPSSNEEKTTFIETEPEEDVVEETKVEDEEIDESDVEDKIEQKTESETTTAIDEEKKITEEKETKENKGTFDTEKVEIDEIATASDAEEVAEEVNVATISDIEEVLEDVNIATASEVVEEIEVATTSEISVKVFWLKDMNLKETGMGGSYNYEWDTFTVEYGKEFEAPEEVTKNVSHTSCNQVYKFVGFTTEDQKTKYWLHADYAGGEKTLDDKFVVDNDMTIWAVYEAENVYVSSIKTVDGELVIKETTIPNLAIKNVIVSDKLFEDLKSGYKVVKDGDKFIAYTKNVEEGKPITKNELTGILSK